MLEVQETGKRAGGRGEETRRTEGRGIKGFTATRTIPYFCVFYTLLTIKDESS